MLQEELSIMSDKVVLDRQTCVMDGHTTQNTHEPCFGDSVTHDLLAMHT